MIIIDPDHITEAEQVKIDSWTAAPTLWQDEILKPERKKRFEFYDKHQLTLPWGDLDAAQKTEFTTWRTAMQNMTATYPTYTALKDITWPADCSFFDTYSE